ncbi:CPBP family intramembrane glutamic endopeptidase [Brachybacterium phenoliresistens]|uniref:CPBP family intramembrane glutamic endopeptidase n=1 Tax=Brachybacterium phenoliresistens TaxID=396014 RepID=UPI0006870AAA|nr:CPBP family intramembrane glutamic endopeptidase [Brachybacterium phenoliresistens]
MDTAAGSASPTPPRSPSADDSGPPRAERAGDGPDQGSRPGCTAPRIPIAWWGLLVRAVAALAILLGANLAAAAALTPLALRFAPNSMPQGLLAVAMCALVCLGVVLLVGLWMRTVERRPLHAVLRPLDPDEPAAAGAPASRARRGARWAAAVRGLAAGTLASVVVMAVVLGIGALLLGGSPGSDPDPGAAGADGGAAPRTAAWLLVLVTVAQAYLLQGIPEEVLYRGWLFSVTRARPMVTLLWTTLAFTIIHLVSSGGQQSALDFVLYLTIPLGFGAFAGALVLVTGSMWVAAGVHGGFHIAIALASALLPAELSGSFGPADWVLTGSVYLAATALVLALRARGRRARAR